MQKKFEDAVDDLYLNWLILGLNTTGMISAGDLREFNECELKKYLERDDYKAKDLIPLKSPSVVYEYEHSSFKKSTVTVLPLSLEDEASLSGTAEILAQFGKEFGIQTDKKESYILFDRKKSEFMLENARERFKFYNCLKQHKVEVERLKEALKADSSFEESELSPSRMASNDNTQENSEASQQNDNTQTICGNATAEKAKMTKVFQELKANVNSFKTVKERVAFLKCRGDAWDAIKDEYERSILHVAVEQRELTLVECLLLCGAKVNETEGCGATPIMIAICNNHEQMCKLLMSYGARTTGTFRGLMPSPLQMAIKIGKQSIVDLIMRQQEFLESIQEKVQQSISLPEWESTNSTNENINDPDAESFENTVDMRKHCITVGDNKTTSNIRSVVQRAPQEYGSFTACPGGFHTTAYVMECVARQIGPGGFYYVIRMLLNRVKVTPSSFKNMFKEGNFQRNFDVLNDYYWGTLVAMVKKFAESEDFPPKSVIDNEVKQSGNANRLLLNAFKDWLGSASDKKDDVQMKYMIEFVCVLGPLMLLYHDSIRHGNGQLNEACYFYMLQLFCAMRKINYKDEIFSHIINFTGEWPLAIREMYRRNMSISMKGRRGHNVAIDEYVETAVVRPLKVYSKKHTTVAMLEKINMNLELLEHVKHVYRSGFDIHCRVDSSTPSSVPDRILIAWFILKEGFFDGASKSSQEVRLFPHHQKDKPAQFKKVPSECLNVMQRGKAYLKDNFNDIPNCLFPNFNVDGI